MTKKKDNRKSIFKKLKYWYFDTHFYIYVGSAFAHPINFLFCLRYPFWKARNVWTGKFLGYNFTDYDELETGWQIAFGKQLSKDIKKAGKESIRRVHKHCRWKDILIWSQIKEKYGTLRLYATATPEITKVLHKYETLSIQYCIYCGKPSKFRVNDGWIHYCCEDCYMRELKDRQFSSYKEKTRIMNSERLK